MACRESVPAPVPVLVRPPRIVWTRRRIAEVGQLDAELPSEAVPLGNRLDALEARIRASRHFAPHLEPSVIAVQRRGRTGATGHRLGGLVQGEDQPQPDYEGEGEGDRADGHRDPRADERVILHRDGERRPADGRA